MRNIKILKIKFLCLFFPLIFIAGPSIAANIDPDLVDQRFAFGENIGWVNFDPAEGPGVTVTDSAVTGFAWAEMSAG